MLENNLFFFIFFLFILFIFIYLVAVYIQQIHIHDYKCIQHYTVKGKVM